MQMIEDLLVGKYFAHSDDDGFTPSKVVGVYHDASNSDYRLIAHAIVGKEGVIEFVSTDLTMETFFENLADCERRCAGYDDADQEGK